MAKEHDGKKKEHMGMGKHGGGMGKTPKEHGFSARVGKHHKKFGKEMSPASAAK
jgi:hypothetical protein